MLPNDESQVAILCDLIDCTPGRGRALVQQHWPRLWHADTAELTRTIGLTDAQARRLIAARQFYHHTLGKVLPAPQATGPATFAISLMAQIGGAAQEHFVVLSLDNKLRCIDQYTLYIGTATGIQMQAGEVFARPIRLGAVQIIVAHNHPSQDVTPSPEDLHLSATLRDAGTLLDIPVRDHIIVGHNAYYSMAESGVVFRS